MTTSIDRIETTATTGGASIITPGERLRATTAPCRVRFTWFGAQKALTPEQRARAAEAFDAEGQSLSAAKRLVDTRHAAFRALTAVRGKIDAYWKATSLPFPEPGLRLIRREKVEEFAATMADLRGELDAAVADLDRHFAGLKAAAAGRLGSLYDPGDYPGSLRGLFAVEIDFPPVEPPAYLVGLSPRIYAEEQARVAARFEEAARLAERAFLREFALLVGHLTERIGGSNEDGSRKVFRDTVVGNLAGFFARFGELDVRSDAELDALVERAQRAVRGVEAQDLRASGALRRRVAAQLTGVRSSLDALLVDRPRRRIWRPAAAPGEA